MRTMNASTREEFLLKSEEQNSIPKSINKKGGIL
jgi:hypothetical protein